MRQKLRHLRFAHFEGMSLAMKKNEAPDPVGIRLLGAETEVFTPDNVADLLEKFRLGWGIRRGYRLGHVP